MKRRRKLAAANIGMASIGASAQLFVRIFFGARVFSLACNRTLDTLILKGEFRRSCSTSPNVQDLTAESDRLGAAIFLLAETSRHCQVRA
jgi:hypothetical protein